MAKFGRIKRQHGRVEGLDALLDRIVRDCPFVLRIVPGRMGRKKGKTPQRLRIQYDTVKPGSQPTGLKCIYTRAGSWQEVFLICSDAAKTRQWLITHVDAEE
ncbi:MAG: DUF2103 domain-containing protein [Phycisphaeraceae bacterium]